MSNNYFDVNLEIHSKLKQKFKIITIISNNDAIN